MAMVSAFNDAVPDWVKQNWQTLCPYCGSYIMDNSDQGKITARWCLNKKCPGHMMHKINSIINYFNVKGIGPETCLRYIKLYKFQNQFDIIPHLFPEKRPTLSLAQIAELACIEGYGGTTAAKELNSYANFTEYFTCCARPDKLLLENKDLLLYGESLFNLKPPRSRSKLYVMGTGSFNGYTNREQYFNAVNNLFGEYVDVIQTGKRKTGVSFLIKEANAVDHSKSQIARECNIPIVTPDEFLSILFDKFPYVYDKLKNIEEDS